MIRLICAAIIALLFGLFGSTSAGSTPPAEAPTVNAYNYDDIHHGAAPTHATTERGPPGTYDPGTTYDAVDHWSQGASARPHEPKLRVESTYDAPTMPAQVTRAAGTTQEELQGSDRNTAEFDRSRVAAKAGPGAWGTAAESTSSRAAAYQARITGRSAGSVYNVNGVKFDGFANGVLQEAKGPGYASLVRNGQFQPWFSGADGLVSQAQRQLAAAGGTPITWSVAEGPAATAINNLFVSRGISGINVIHVP